MSDSQILDVRLSEDFDAAHIQGAKNNCVFEVDFESRLPDTAPSKDMHTLVYGANDQSYEAPMAVEKMERLGYTDVQVMPGGIAKAEKDQIIKGTPLPSEAPEPDGTYEIDLSESKVIWTGRNIINSHTGTIGIQSGELNFHSGELVDGEVILNFHDMKCSDLEGTPGHDILIDHLKGHDFFDVDHFPTATVSILGGNENEVEADLQMKGITRQITIPIAAGFDANGNPATQAAFVIDRTDWNIIYGSRRFFHRLAGHVVNDEIQIELRILTKPQ
ncbi:MAG: YceI family protein [Akkermansiaceae bacterium]